MKKAIFVLIVGIIVLNSCKMDDSPPNVPSNLNPQNGAMQVSTSPTLSWDTSNSATSYTLQVSTNKEFSSFVYNKSGLKKTKQHISNLSNNTLYDWRVSAKNNFGKSDYTKTNSFKTKSFTCEDQIVYSGKVYNTVKIGTQCWLKENLDVGTMVRGDKQQKKNGIIEKYCYGNDTANCNKYGGLYQWDEAMKYSTISGTQGICPPGWHIPVRDEFKSLASGVYFQGNALKEIGQGTGTNTSGFAALMAGYYFNFITGGFYDLGNKTFFWGSTEDYSETVSMMVVYSIGNNIRQTISVKFTGISIRCIKD